MPKKPELSAADQALRESMGAAIRQASSSRGSKPVDLAKAGGVSLAHQYRIESGDRTADALYLVKVASLLNVTVDELIRPKSQNLTQPPPEARTQTVNATMRGVVAGGDVSISGNSVKNKK